VNIEDGPGDDEYTIKQYYICSDCDRDLDGEVVKKAS